LAPFFPFQKASWQAGAARVRRLLRIAFYGAGALVATLSLAPGATLPATSIGDKMEHAIAYAVLGLLGATSSGRGTMRTILGLAAFGLIIEGLQTFSPGPLTGSARRRGGRHRRRPWRRCGDRAAPYDMVVD
jgi:hypothetical protein